MKNFLLFKLFTLLIAFTLNSCGKDDDKVDPEPTPSPVGINQNRKIIERGEYVQFLPILRVPKIARYEWDFGNGQTSTNKFAGSQYNNLGTYTVKLTVYDSLNQAYSTTSTVKVGKRYLTNITIQQISFTRSDGQPWDIISPNPDLGIRIGPEYNKFDHIYNFYRDFTPDKLPYTFNIPDTISLGTVKYFFLVDDDNDIVPNDYNIMYSFWTGTMQPPVKDYETGTGTILGDYSQYSYKFLLGFEVR